MHCPEKTNQKDASPSPAGPAENEWLSDNAYTPLRLSSDSDSSEGGCQNKCSKQNCYLLLASCLAALGGLMFGYDTGIISGALLQLEEDFQLSCHDVELVVSMMLIGALVAALIAGTLVDRIGRRLSVIINAVIFTIGSVILASSINLYMMVFGRLVIGFAVSLSAIAECIYISEISPNIRRGFLVSLNEFSITAGFLFAYLVNYLLINISHGWRYMFGIGVLPAIIQGVGMLYMPKSPRFLLLQQDDFQARSVLLQVRCNSGVDAEMREIRNTLSKEKNMSYMDLFRVKDNMLRRMVIGIVLVMFQQITGQPNILYYAPTVFQQLGYRSSSAATLAAVGLGLVKVLFTGVALYQLDKWGRQKLLIAGTTIMMLSVLTLALVIMAYKLSFYVVHPCSNTEDQLPTPDGSLTNDSYIIHTSDIAQSDFTASIKSILEETGSNKVGKPGTGVQKTSHNDTSVMLHLTISGVTKIQDNFNATNSTSDLSVSDLPGMAVWLTSISLLIFVAGYSLGFGPGTWLVLSEIFPAAVRGRAMSFATVFNWLFNFVITSTFLDAISTLSVSVTFLCYGLLCGLAIIFIWLCIPETKGKSLEEITSELKKWSCKQHFRWGICCTRPSPDLTVQYRLIDTTTNDLE